MTAEPLVPNRYFIQPGEARMPLIDRRGRVAGLIAGFGLSLSLAGPAHGQTVPLPDALPPLPTPTLEGSSGPVVMTGPAVAVPPEVRPTPTVVQVPLEGFHPTWFREADDPVATRRHPPKFVEHKKRSNFWRRLQGKFYGYPEEYVPRPLGAAMYDHALIMTANGVAARLTLYDYDFIQGSSELSPRGAEQLSKLVPQLLASPYPLIVERTPADPRLAASRRELVATRLAQGPCPIPPDRVLVGVPIANGLSGVDAQVIAGNALGRVQQYGPPIPINSNGVNSPSGVTNSSGTGGP